MLLKNYTTSSVAMNVDLDSTGKTFWGRSAWGVIHTFASIADANPQQIRLFERWINTLPKLIPCKAVCGPHLEDNLEKMPLQKYLDENTPNKSRANKSVLEWTYLLHDEVNRLNGKESPALAVVLTYYRYSHVKPYVFHRELLWVFLHSIAYDYNPETRKSMIDFIALTGALLPDEKIKRQWKEFTDTYELKLYLHDLYDCFYYTYMLRNYIDHQQGQYPVISIDDLKQYYRRRFGIPNREESKGEECPSCS